MALPIIVPIAYVAFLFVPLYIFSKYYRRKQNYRAASASSNWFTEAHHSRDIYVSLLGLTPQPPNHILAAALLRRAMTDVTRIANIRESKQSLSQLLQKGLIGDDFWNAFLEAEKELEAELLEVQAEAETFRTGWGGYIFQQAMDMVQHQRIKDVVANIDNDRQKIGRENPTLTAPENAPVVTAVRQAPQATAAMPKPQTLSSPPTVQSSPSHTSEIGSEAEEASTGTKTPSKKNKKNKKKK